MTGTLVDARPDSLVADGKRAAALANVADVLATLGATGVVLAARGGEVLFARSIAAAEPDDPLTANTLLEIASASKQFVATAVVLLQERGLINLDGSIGDYVAGVPPNCRGITLRHLLNHTSGLHNGSRAASLEEYLAACLGDGPKHPPGTYFEYSDSALSLAAGIVGKVSGLSYTQFVATELFQPAGMRTACFTGDLLPPGATQATGRSGEGQSRTALDHPYAGFKWYNGMGGAVLNVWDLWAWDRALRQSDILSEEGKRELFTPGPGSHGLGWFVETQKGRLSYAHAGSVRGFRTLVARYPDDDGALFVLLNDDRLNPQGIAGLFQQALFDHVPQLPPRLLGQALQDAVTGHYVDASGVEWKFEADGPVTYAHRYYRDEKIPFWLLCGYVGLTEEGAPILYEWKYQGLLPHVALDPVQTPIDITKTSKGEARLCIGEYEANRMP